MITTAIALLTAALPALGTILGGTTVTSIFAWLASPLGKGTVKLGQELIKAAGKPLPPDTAARLKRMNEAARMALTKQQYNDYVYKGIKTW